MAILNQNSPDKLCAEILGDAQREREAVLGRAQTEAVAILAAAQAEADKIRREQREQAQADAARRWDRILATVAVEAGRLRSARIEAVLESIRTEVRRRLSAANANGRETLVALAAEAISRMPENSFVLEISAADHAALGNGLVREIVERTGRPRLNLAVSVDGSVAGGGVMIREAGGTQYWDNRLLSRLDRFWPELRRQIAVQSSLVGENHAAGGES
jgi:vacuolar-type H+-ATPase subunit E/Vma4